MLTAIKLYTSYGFYLLLYKFAHHCFFFWGSQWVVYLEQVSAFAKQIEHGIMVDRFEEETIA